MHVLSTCVFKLRTWLYVLFCFWLCSLGIAFGAIRIPLSVSRLWPLSAAYPMEEHCISVSAEMHTTSSWLQLLITTDDSTMNISVRIPLHKNFLSWCPWGCLLVGVCVYTASEGGLSWPPPEPSVHSPQPCVRIALFPPAFANIQLSNFSSVLYSNSLLLF